MASGVPGHGAGAAGRLAPLRHRAAAAPRRDRRDRRGRRGRAGRRAHPSLVHFDIWPGNVFLTFGDGPPRIQAIIDHERSFWGDPLADFVTPTIFGELDETDDLVTGYREAGGTVELTPSARTRLALYRAYLYLILLVENGPRQYPEESYARVRDLSVTHLTEILARLRTA
ncbi:phosphotransferase family protein [Thermocatellispora tengchongensis]|uniref:phosphotransferase family protein n=1 Tax=Thermocatellispora tengchongensis TaxID=1073253 RepID=UPI0036399013